VTTCPQCGTAVPSGASACPQCGVLVTDPVAKTLAIATEDVAERDALLARLRHELAEEYEVERELGRGGMGVVFKAVEIELGRPVALKVLPPGLGQGASAERFRREARLAAALDHPNIIPIYRVGRAAGTYYFAMKLVEGRALDEIIEAQGALPLQVILAVLRSTTSALAFAHDRQIVHRDIKGANILVDHDGRVLISDFGIARAGQEKTLTAAGAMMGTPYYMSPEQGWGGEVGPQSDQYALGILTFQMITGQVPFDADSLLSILQHHYFTPPPDVRSVREGLPAGLVQVLETALRKNAGDRFASTREMLAAVEAIPSSEAERAEAHEMLRQLAHGGTVAKVRTGSLPPLDNKNFASLAVTAGLAGAPIHLVPPTPATPAPLPRLALPLRRAALVLAAVAAFSGLWWLGHPSPVSVQPPGAATSPASAPSRPASSQSATQRGASSRGAPAPDAAARYATQLPPAGGAGIVRLYTIPLNATIAVDGQDVGAGLLSNVPVAAGQRRLRISAPGYATLDTMISVTAGKLADIGLIRLKRASR